MPNTNRKGQEGAGSLTGSGRGICRRTVGDVWNDQGGCRAQGGSGRRKGQARAGRGQEVTNGAAPDRALVPENELSSLHRQIEENQRVLDSLMTRVGKLGFNRE